MSGAPVAARTSSSLTPGAHSTRVRPVLEPVLEFVVTLDVVVVVEIVEQLKLFGDLGFRLDRDEPLSLVLATWL